LALIGRTPLPPREQWRTLPENSRPARRVLQVERLEAMGARVFVGCADVGDQESLTACLRDLSQSGWPGIRGVIHAAGVMSYQSFREATVANFRDTLHAKAVGAWLLHESTLGSPLDCFVMFSSAAGVLNMPFVGAYAAANAFMDGLSHRRGEQALASISVSWGLWRGTGMGEDVSDRELEILKARGMDSIPADTGVELFGLLPEQKSCHLAVMPIDWQKWECVFPAVAGLPFFSRVIGVSTGNHAAAHPDLRAAIAAATGAERAVLLRQCTRRHIAEVLGLSEPDLDDSTCITRLGLDSLMATELRNRLLADTGCSLPLVRVLEGPSTAELVALLESVLDATAAAAPSSPLKPAPAAAGAAAAEADRMLRDLDQLSDQDVDRMLQEMLQEKEIDS
jgi:acyl carrier protein